MGVLSWILLAACMLWSALRFLPAGREAHMPTMPYMIALIRFCGYRTWSSRYGPVWSARGGNAASPSPASCRYLPCRFRIGRTCHGNDGTTSVEHPMKQRQTTIARPRDPPTPSRPRTLRRRAATPTI